MNSNYMNKTIPYHYGSMVSNNSTDTFEFNHIEHNPEHSIALMRHISNKESMRKRALDRYREFSANPNISLLTDGDIGVSGSKLTVARNIVDSIISDNISNSTPYDKDKFIKLVPSLRNIIRTNLGNVIGTSNINLIISKRNGSINMWIDSIGEKYGMDDISNYSFNSNGLSLSNNSVVTLMISEKYLMETMVSAGRIATSNVLSSNNAPAPSNLKAARILEETREVAVVMIANRLVVSELTALYTCMVHNRVAKDMYNEINKFIMPTKKNHTSTYVNNTKDITSLSYFGIGNLIGNLDMDYLDPHTMMDVFDISEYELNIFITSIVPSLVDNTPLANHTWYLHCGDSDYATRNDSLVAHSIHISRLMDMIIFTRLMSKHSMSTNLVRDIKTRLGVTIAGIRSSGIQNKTRGLTLIIDYLSFQLNVLNDLSNNVVKVNKYRESTRGASNAKFNAIQTIG